MPKVVRLARNSDHSVIAANWPRPAGSSVRAVRMPVAALSTCTSNLAPVVCATARMPPCPVLLAVLSVATGGIASGGAATSEVLMSVCPTARDRLPLVYRSALAGRSLRHG